MLTVPPNQPKLLHMLPSSKAKNLAVLCLFALMPLLAPASGQTQSAGYLIRQNLSGSPGGNLVTAISSDPSNFNSLMAGSYVTRIVAERLSADLVHIDRETFELEPALAERWEVAKDGRTYTIHLRRGLRFSDGSPFDADDVVFSFQVLADPRTDSVLGSQAKIDGAYPAVSKIDANTVRLVFSRPVGMGLRCLDAIPMLPSRKLAKAFQEGKIASAWGPAAQPQDIAGLGPFRLKEYRRGEQVVLEHNPYYWKKDKSGQTLPYLDTITFVIIPDRNAEALRFESGELDVVSTLNAENYASLRRSEKERNYTIRDLGPGLRVDYFWFNLNPGKDKSGRPFVDPQKRALFEQAKFRQAVSGALDRDGMARSILLGLGTSQFGPISSGNKPWYKADTPRPPFDPARARELLAQIGLKDTNSDGVLEFGEPRRPLEIDLLVPRGNAVRERSAEVIKENLSKIGIRVNLQPVLTNELVGRLQENFNYEAILFGFTPTDVAPDLQIDVWYSSGKNHFWHPGQTKPERPWEAEIDAQISRLVHSLDPAVRKTCFNRVQEIWADEMPAIATIAPHIITGYTNRLGNLRPSILEPSTLWNAEELTKR